MSRKFTLGVIGFVLLSLLFITSALPAVASAQAGQDLGATSAIYCPNLSVTLQFGSRDSQTGGQVTELQTFLVDYYNLNPDTYISGYFGRLTQQNVIRFQQEQNLPAYGIVGSLTRAAIGKVCGGGNVSSCTDEYKPMCGQPSSHCNAPPDSVCLNVMPAPKTYSNRCLMNTDGATFLYEGICRPDPTPNRPPIIFSFSGPPYLAVNETGTWTIQASDPENGQLTYRIDWGDTPTPFERILQLAGLSAFTHSYSAAGSYIISVTVGDSGGKEADTTTTVQVGSSVGSCTLGNTPVCGTKYESGLQYCPPSSPTTGPCRKDYTYSNRCLLNVDGAMFVNEGVCK